MSERGAPSPPDGDPTLEGRRALVTGAAGFVGVNLCAHLAAAGAEVHGTVRPDSDSTWRLPALRSVASVHAVDLAAAAGLPGLLRRIRPEVVFHAAVRSAFDREAGVAAWVADGVLALARLLDAAAALPAPERPRIVHCGSFLVYPPRRDASPHRESDPLAPTSLRGAVKAAAALAGAAGARELGLAFTELRLFTVYGPWEAPHRLVPRALYAALHGEELPLTPAGLRRDLVYVDDVVRACADAGFAPDFRALDGEVVQIGSGIETANEEIVRAIEEATGRPIALRPGAFAPRETDRPHCRADPARARELLGWHPRYDLVAGLRETAAWMAAREAAG